MKKKWLAAVAMLGSMCVLTGCGTAELDLSKYVKVEFDGIDGEGTVSNYYIDEEKLEDAIKEANDDLSNRERERLMNSIKLELKDGTELSNGDKVKLEIDWSERRAEKYGFEFTTDEAEVKVKGLKELEEIDAFKDLEIEYEGVSPYLSMSVENSSDNEFLETCYYDVEGPDEDSYYLKAGDEVTVTVSYSEYDAEELGYTVKETEKKIEIPEKEVDVYVEKNDQLKEATEDMSAAAKAAVDEGIFNNSYHYTAMMSKLTGAQYGWDFDMATITREGGILEPVANEYKLDKVLVHAVKEVDDGRYKYNYVTYIFENTVKDSVNVNPVNVFYAVSYNNVILKADGTVEYDEDDLWVSAYGTNIDDVEKKLTEEFGNDYEKKDESSIQ